LKCLYTLWVLAIFLLCPDSGGSIASADGADIRAPIFAGTWYPGDKDTLQKSIHGFLAKAKKDQLSGNLKAIVVPHAGHIYSGQTAAHAYRLVQGMDIQRVIMIGPSHQHRFHGVSVNGRSGYMTPLGMVPVDLPVVKQLILADDMIRYVPEAHNREHCLEIQLPFLQTVLNRFHIIPIIMGGQDFHTCSALAEVLIKVAGPLRKTIILASTDLSHFHSDTQAKKLDGEFIRHVKAMDAEGLTECLSSRTCEACGGGPVITTLLTAKGLGANGTEILGYTHSGEITGDNRRVVGYMSAAFFKSNKINP
jgi:AmmeMemoRadiSam system protein B